MSRRWLSARGRSLARTDPVPVGLTPVTLTGLRLVAWASPRPVAWTGLGLAGLQG